MAYGTAVLCIAALLLVGGALGALLTFAETPRYSHYAQTSVWGLTNLQDQHLAGAIMWIPAGIFYGTVAVTLFVRWFAAIDSTAQVATGPTRAPSGSPTPRERGIPMSAPPP